jgi:hypothetical protein
MNYDDSITIKMTGEFLVLAEKLSNYICELPLNHEENVKLIKLILSQTEQAKSDSFKQGFETAANVLNH